MLISQPQRRIIFQQIKLFQITNNSYKTNTHFQNTNNQFLRIQQRHYGIKDFFESFREKLDENIKQTPEFGGDLKRLSDTSTSAKQAAGKVAESVEAVKKKTQEFIDPIAANPNVKEAGKKAVEATGMFRTLLGYVFSTILDNIFVHTIPIKRRIKKLKTKKVLDEIFMYRFATTRDRFDPTIFDESLLTVDGQPEKQALRTAEMIEYQEKQWDNFREKVNKKLSNLGEGDTRLSVLIERADSYGSSLKKMSTSRITAIVDEIRTVFPNFRYENFRDWVCKILFVRLIRGDPGYFPFQSGRVAKKFYDKVLPKPWIRIRVFHVDVYEHPESNYAFIFTLRGRAMHNETDKETEITTVKPVAFTISLALKLNEMGCWIISDYHEIEITDAPF